VGISGQTDALCIPHQFNSSRRFLRRWRYGAGGTDSGCFTFVRSFYIFLLFSRKEIEIKLAEKLKIIPLGGLDEIGKNITVLEYGKDMIVVDCGVGFPDEDMYGVDLVIPDFSYLVQNAKKLRGMFITHGHEDHIGSIPYCMQQVS
jgi:hypothetical protein